MEIARQAAATKSTRYPKGRLDCAKRFFMSTTFQHREGTERLLRRTSACSEQVGRHVSAQLQVERDGPFSFARHSRAWWSGSIRTTLPEFCRLAHGAEPDSDLGICLRCWAEAKRCHSAFSHPPRRTNVTRRATRCTGMVRDTTRRCGRSRNYHHGAASASK